MQNAHTAAHEADVKKLQADLEACSQENTQRVTLAKTSSQSNTTRSAEYKKNTKKLSVDGLNRVLLVDAERMVAVAEPRVSMKELAQQTFKQGLIPLVVPEFKGITVGGAIMGCGGESTSHNHGLFHDICTYFEVLTGDGRVIKASSEENVDLFDSIAGSYGSLGVLLSAEIRLQRALSWVTLRVHHCRSGHEAIERMRQLMSNDIPPEYLEGIIFSDAHAVIIEGEQTAHPCETVFSDGPFSDWYYAFTQKQKVEFSMPLLDYLFRYDRGAFWMGAYVLCLPILKKLFLEGIWKVQTPKPFTLKERLRFSKIEAPNSVVRPFTYPFTSSQTLFKMLHACPDWVNDRFMIQDFTLPVATVSAFLDELCQICPIYPLWLCPLKAQKSSQLFAPHNLDGTDSINIGVYGIPNNAAPLLESLKMVEQVLTKLQGRKWLYANSCYTLDEFWAIYNKSKYQDLRDRYKADKTLLSIENKVLSL